MDGRLIRSSDLTITLISGPLSLKLLFYFETLYRISLLLVKSWEHVPVHLEIKQASQVKVQRSQNINCLLEYFVFELEVFHNLLLYSFHKSSTLPFQNIGTSWWNAGFVKLSQKTVYKPWRKLSKEIEVPVLLDLLGKKKKKK